MNPNNPNMKLIPVFLIIFLFSSSLILAYIAWTTILSNQAEKFLANEEKSNSKSTSSYDESGSGQESSSKHGKNNNNIGILQNLIPFLRHNNVHNENGISNLASVDEKSLFGEALLKNVEKLKMKSISNLRRYLLNGAKVSGHVNPYSVNFTQFKQKNLKKPNVHEMMCRIKNLPIDILNENTSPVFQDKTFPEKSLFDESRISSMEKSFIEQIKYKGKSKSQISSSSSSPSTTASKLSNNNNNNNNIVKERDLDEPIYRSCAVVPNSAALDGAQHGIDIDSHDFILRFNNAPTEGYEEDVGTLTSMRIINSQVVTKPQFLFPHSSYFNDMLISPEFKKNPKETSSLNAIWQATRKFLMWDPCQYSSTVEEWYESPEFPLFDKYFNITSQNNQYYGRNRFYVLNCRSIWKMWDLLQEYSIGKIYGTPPTSGFIGIMLTLQICERVDIYEYIPSSHESVRCNYYGPKNDSNPSCTYGSWHPVSAEKLFALELSDSTDKQIFMDGYLSIPGVSNFKCNN